MLCNRYLVGRFYLVLQLARPTLLCSIYDVCGLPLMQFESEPGRLDLFVTFAQGFSQKPENVVQAIWRIDFVNPRLDFFSHSEASVFLFIHSSFFLLFTVEDNRLRTGAMYIKLLLI